MRRRQAERRKRLKVTVDRIEQELAKVGFSNIRDHTEPDGSIDLKKADYDVAAAIQSVEIETFEMAGPGPADQSGQRPVIVAKTTKFKLHAKTPALELLGKRHKMFSEKIEHSGKVTVVVDL